MFRKKQDMIYEIQPRFEYRQDRFLQRLHLNGPGREQQNIRKMVRPLAALASSLVRLHGLVLLGRHEFATGIPEADKMAGQLIFLCWACPEAVRQVEILSGQGKLMEAYLLDELINDSLFYASVSLERTADSLLADQGLTLKSVYYPEDCQDGPDRIRLFLDLIKSRRPVEVSLSEAGILIPVKSLLYAASAAEIVLPEGRGRAVGESAGKKDGRVSKRPAAGKENKDSEEGAGRPCGPGRHDCSNCKKEGCAFRISL